MTIAEEVSSTSDLRISAVVTCVNSQQQPLGYIRRCPGKMGCKTCLGLIRMCGDSDSSSSYSLECNCKCHNGPGGIRKTYLDFQQMKKALEAANIAELQQQQQQNQKNQEKAIIKGDYPLEIVSSSKEVGSGKGRGRPPIKFKSRFKSTFKARALDKQKYSMQNSYTDKGDVATL